MQKCPLANPSSARCLVCGEVSSKWEGFIPKARMLEISRPTWQRDGPSAPALKDNMGNKIKVADFTQPDGMLRGKNVMDIYTSFMAGLNGTHMPSYAKVVSPSEVWDLAYYVWRLRRGARP